MKANSRVACAICKTALGISKDGMKGIDTRFTDGFSDLRGNEPLSSSFPLAKLGSVYCGNDCEAFSLFARINLELQISKAG